MTVHPLHVHATRRQILGAAAAWGLGTGVTASHGVVPPAPKKVLRLALRNAESGFDPARIGDMYSRSITAHVLEGLLSYDPLARPVRLVPLLAEALPEVHAQHTRWVFRLRRGVRFAPHPVWPEGPREVLAQDFIYSWMRFADPALHSPGWNELEELGIEGLQSYREACIAGRQRFDPHHPIPGLQALDAHTLEIRLNQPCPRLGELLAQGDLYGVVAHEVVAHHGGSLMEAPHGTGPFQLVQWRRSSFIALERNPTYRERRYEAEPAPEDAEGHAWAQQLRGRRLPMVDRVEISIIEESQPRWLAFLQGQLDVLAPVPEEFAAVALPQGRRSELLKRRGIQAWRTPNPDVLFTVFNMEDPVVGGVSPPQVALRRAVALGTDVRREIHLARHQQAVLAESFAPPGTFGHDPSFHTAAYHHDPERARALLDLYGWRDRDGDGWREQPNGAPLCLDVLTTPESIQRQIDELWASDMRTIGIKVAFRPGRWPEHFKALRAGHFQVWSLALEVGKPDAQDVLQLFDSRQIGTNNFARVRLPVLDQLIQNAQQLPNGPARQAVFREAARWAAAYMPYRFRAHRFSTDLAHRWVRGYRRPLFGMSWWETVDLDPRARPDTTTDGLRPSDR